MGFLLQQNSTPEELTGLDYNALFIFWAIVLLLVLLVIIWVLKRKNKS